MNNYQEIIKEIKTKYPNLYSIYKDDDLKILASFYNLAKFSLDDVKEDILKKAMDNSKDKDLKNINDFYFVLFASIKEVSGFSKKAYPQFPLELSDDYDSEFDLDKWAKLVYKVYDAVLANDMSLQNAIDYYADTLNNKKGEDFKFKQWIKYYLDGENKRYAKEEFVMEKKSDYQFGLNNSSFYYPDTKPIPEGNTPVKKKMENNIEEAKKKEVIKQWREKLDGAIRRIDKLIRSIEPTIDSDKAQELARSLHDFDMNVRKIRHQLTASDLTYQAANKFKKMGFDDGHAILYKTAQEVSPLDLEGAPDETPQDLQEEVKSGDPVERVYENVSGAKEGEYEKLSEDIQLTDAITKLEEIAARLSDRRVVRLLAEFDIMLDKIGIASMFPELAESQSKLIDSYSYSLVRVTKMLGMLSSGKNLSDLAEARKSEMTQNVRKEVGKSLAKGEEPTPPREEAISEEFGEQPQPQPEPELPPTQEVTPEQ